MALLDEVFVHRRDLDHDILGAVGNTLTTQTGLQRSHGRFVQLVELVIGALITAVEPLFHNDVTS